ncbi:MAG TPA: sugar kinase [Gemmataceae bacterium]|jgi:2-dehydro-3-deoxygluconokinase
MPDVITFGEAMLRLTPPGFRRLEHAHAFDAEVGGAELNTAVGLVRLGRSAAWVSRLPDNPLGRWLAGKVREAGIGTAHVELADDGRLGLYFLEVGAAPRPSSILYDRRDSSFSRLQPESIDWPAVLAGAKWFHVTGITPALGPGSAAATLEALRAARAAGVRVSIDPNYRAKLWSVADARRWLEAALPLCDVLITGGGLAGDVPDAEALFGVAVADAATVGRALAQRFGLKVVAVTQRDSGRVWHNAFTAVAVAGGDVLTTRTYNVEVVDRLGAGDAFAAGLIHGLLDNDVQRGLDYGAAMAALKHSVPGDFPAATLAEVQDLLAGGGVRISR